MNRTVTPYLIAAVLVLGLLAYLSERPRRTSEGARARGARDTSVLRVDPEDVQRIRMRRDFWNSYTLARDEERRWTLEEPSRGPAHEAEVRRLLETLTFLPSAQILDMPGDDSERYREYGLWEPALEFTLATAGGSVHTLMFGAKTPDETGVYTVVHGVARVHVVPVEAFEILQRGADTYRAEP